MAANSRALRILAVDDEPVVLDMLKDALALDGHAVLALARATDGDAHLGGKDIDQKILN